MKNIDEYHQCQFRAPGPWIQKPPPLPLRDLVYHWPQEHIQRLIAIRLQALFCQKYFGVQGTCYLLNNCTYQPVVFWDNSTSETYRYSSQVDDRCPGPLSRSARHDGPRSAGRRESVGSVAKMSGGGFGLSSGPSGLVLPSIFAPTITGIRDLRNFQSRSL